MLYAKHSLFRAIAAQYILVLIFSKNMCLLPHCNLYRNRQGCLSCSFILIPTHLSCHLIKKICAKIHLARIRLLGMQLFFYSESTSFLIIAANLKQLFLTVSMGTPARQQESSHYFMYSQKTFFCLTWKCIGFPSSRMDSLEALEDRFLLEVLISLYWVLPCNLIRFTKQRPHDIV